MRGYIETITWQKHDQSMVNNFTFTVEGYSAVTVIKPFYEMHDFSHQICTLRCGR